MHNGRRDTFVIRMKVRDEHGNVVGETEAINFKGLLAIAHDEGSSPFGPSLFKYRTRRTTGPRSCAPPAARGRGSSRASATRARRT